MAATSSLKSITLGGGCFWCIESVFRRVRGVQKTLSGYAGGRVDNPTYKQVCNGDTGHAEVVQVDYNPSVIDTEKILQIFFYVHDPTQLNGQGNDIGTQYRSAVFYHDLEQKSMAEKLIDEMNKSAKYQDKIVTELTKLEKFYPAEDYHQNYFELNPYQGYCQAVVRPKVEKFAKTFKEYLKN